MNEDRKSKRQKSLNNKKNSKKSYDEDNNYKQLNKQFKAKRKEIIENDDDWKNWDSDTEN